MNIVVTLLLVASGGMVKSDESTAEVEWSVDYAEAFAAAKSSKKPMLVIIEDSTNRDNQFNEDRLASEPTQVELLNEFELVKIDASSKKGKKIADAWGAKQLPYTAITDRTNSIVVYRKAGQMSRNEWISALIDSKDRVHTRKPVLPQTESSQYAQPIYASPSAQPISQQNFNWTYPSTGFRTYSRAACAT